MIAITNGLETGSSFAPNRIASFAIFRGLNEIGYKDTKKYCFLHIFLQNCAKK